MVRTLLSGNLIEMKKHPQPADLQSTADAIAERLVPFWGRAASVPEGIAIQAAVALGGNLPWYVEAAVDPPTADTAWSGRVVLISDDLFVTMVKQSSGERADTVAVIRPFHPIAVHLLGDDEAWQAMPGTRPPGTAFLEFVFKDAPNLRVPMATGSLRLPANDEALWEHFFEILHRLPSQG